MTQVRQERTGWRDERVSRRHREWGYDCPALDIDFLLLEYDRGRAAAVVEYKHEASPSVRLAHPSVRAIVDLADRAGLPAFVVRYADDFSWWYPTPLNERAQRLCPGGARLTEEQWVDLLYRCRGGRLPPGGAQRA
ncbi:MAG: hypothetical protein FJ288_16085 [Planctomycetes bacterium]|nr:hypothetical protein [Planctomycetota bacterium]